MAIQDDYLAFMMQVDPTTAGADRQRAVSNRLRGMMGVGALGSTSQIKEIAGAGTGAMDQAVGMGRQMGEDRRDRLGDELAAESAGSGWRGTASERKMLIEHANDARMTAGLLESFSDEFGNTGGPGSEFRESLTLGAMQNFPAVTEWASDKPGAEFVGLKKSGEQAQETKDRLRRESTWWTNYKRFSEIPERNEIFGATMTPSEQKEWQAAEINPRMRPEQIRSRLQKRIAIANDVFKRMEDQYRALGMNDEFLNITGQDIQATGQSVGEILTDQPSGARPVSSGPPAGVSAADWDTLDDDEKAFYLNNMGGQ